MQIKFKFSQQFLAVKKYLLKLQDEIRQALENVDGNCFKETNWKYRGRGGGKTLLLENSIERFNRVTKGKKPIPVFEKAGLNVSAIGGTMPKAMADVLKVEEDFFNACGLSLVFHPFSPMIPTIHMNVRFFEMPSGTKSIHWFGGGTDLTPYYPFVSDFRDFHEHQKNAIGLIDSKLYKKFKQTCDEYFYLPHRQEMRGIGGIFFDYLKNDFEKNFKLIRSVGDSFIPSYLPIVVKRKYTRFGKREKKFQLFRRGRYVEFNLLYDRGTLFGLKTGGRVDSIMMSLPPQVVFPTELDFPIKGFEKEMLKFYQPQEWC